MNTSWSTIFRTWFPLAVVSTILSLGAYGIGQQVYRAAANDPQYQQSISTVANIDFGSDPRSLVGPRKNNLATSNQVFTIITDAAGKVLATDAMLDGVERVPPIGSLHFAAQHGVNAITWQPKIGVRLATVIRPNSSGTKFVVVGRSLMDTEHRISKLGQLAWCVWLTSLIGSLVAIALVQPRHSALQPLRAKRRKTN